MRRSIVVPVVILLLGACQEDGAGLDGPPPPSPPLLGSTSTPAVPTNAVLSSRCDPYGPPCVDPLVVVPSWTVAEPWSIAEVELDFDLNGDGYLDAEITLDDGPNLHGSILFGPLHRDVELPTDEDVSVMGAGVRWIGDATGDGVLDVVTEGRDTSVGGEVRDALELVPGPIGAIVDPSTAAIGAWPSTSTVHDLTGDGVVDYVPYHRTAIQLWSGPYTTWGVGSPTLELTFACATEEDSAPSLSTSIPDMDGDGQRELCASVALWVDEACDKFRVPASTVGSVELTESPPEATCHTPAGDQDGDGVTDWFDASYQVVAGPLTWSAGVVSSPTILTPAANVRYLGSLGMDLDSDGYADFVAEDLATFPIQYRLLRGGPSGDVASGIPLLMVIESPGMALVEGDEAFWVVTGGDRRDVRFLPLGSPASTVPR